ncbi:DNA polymerase III subunit epsilon [Corynebacterium sp.]|uniref:DNA polymerase III subunit epsilon n=1 Tax=Corynebacterium sp. TaxID=1720 RepID=UPI0026DC01B2|nr:DNA polymerase III subunit epsilon [Corynebacterium sp.]MDO5031830.1 DNA polymerase III subunit epsilon [Corynebacterium sp.]
MTTTPGTPAPAADSPASASPAQSPSHHAPKPGPTTHRSTASADARSRNEQRQAAQAEAVAAFPFVALTMQTTGIHPSTGRLLTIDALTFNESGEVGQDFHAVLNPDGDPGPFHLHGLSREEIAQGQSFSALLKPLDRLIDGRTLIVHDTPYTWGFLVSEARRAMTAAARQNRARGRNRSKGRRRRTKVGHVPAPVAIIDTLASARLQEIWENDVRLAAVARRAGLDAEDPTASHERAQRSEAETSRAATETLLALYQRLAAGPLNSYTPEDLRADRFGLQRSQLRVDAAEAPRMHHNPGPYVPGKELRRGMEIVVAPEIAMDPDVIIEALVREELNYSEKLTRETSLVVCNITTDLVGKPMHAHRKDIPLMADEAFLAALERIEEAVEPSEEPSSSGQRSRPSQPQQKNRRSGGSARRRSKRRSGSQQGAGQNGGNSNSNSSNNQQSSDSTIGNNGSKGNTGNKGSNNKSGNSRRRRRRGGRNRRGGKGNSQNSGHNRGRTHDS